MTVSRRSFFKRAAQVVALVVVSPIALKISAATAVKEVSAAPVKEAVSRCSDFCPQITIQDYVPGQPITYQELGVDGSCQMCTWNNRCTGEGGKFIDAGLTDMEIWSKKLTKKWYEGVVKEIMV